jgi:protoporphyrinogen oxidase
MKVIVIGAGPAGLTAAYQLVKRGVEVELFEADVQVGGMARSFELWNQQVDCGPHRFFSSDPRVNEIWLEAVKGRYAMVSRLTRIFYRGHFFYYPLRAFNALFNLGPLESLRCLGSYLVEKTGLTGKRDQSAFEGWVISRFGRRLYEIFFKTYSEKLWGIPCSELDADFAAQRIKNFSLGEALKSILLPRSRKKHKTLVDEFAYPHSGSGYVYEQMAAFVKQNGGVVHFGTQIKRVLFHDGRAVGVQSVAGDEYHGDHVISSMPLTQLVAAMDGVSQSVANACAHLNYRNTILIYLKVGNDAIFPDNWLYVHDSTLLTGRITNFRNWVPELYGSATSTVIAMEYWCYSNDELWHRSDAQLIKLAKDEIEHTRLVNIDEVQDGFVKRVERCYPVYAKGYGEQLKVVKSYLDGFDRLAVIGRYGAFKYNNQDHSILMGLLAAENICDNAGHDLWSINTDYVYQEAAVITQTGLVLTKS